jgi:CobQ-like glutamine amidotransferase family enzyme
LGNVTPTLRICHLYPDLLNLYGDRGNVIVLVNRARWRGLQVVVTEATLGTAIGADDADLYFIGGGEDRQQRIAVSDLLRLKRGPLEEAARAGAVVLAVCGGYQLVGRFYRPAEGEELPGLGLLDIWTEHAGPGTARLIGNLVIQPDGDEPPMVGFENHGGRTYLGPAAKPLGRVVSGFGNNGRDGWEGAVAGHVYGTYLHGPLLPKNPAFADRLIREALSRRYPGTELVALPDVLEGRARAAVLARTGRPASA